MKYQIDGVINKKELENAINEVKKREELAKYRTQGVSDRFINSDKERDSNGRDGRGVSDNATQYGPESNSVSRLGENETEQWELRGNTSGSDEYDSKNRQVAGVNNDIQFSSPIASADTDVESDVNIKSNKAKNYYDRYSKTAKKDIGKILGIPRLRLGVIDGNVDEREYEQICQIKTKDFSLVFIVVFKLFYTIKSISPVSGLDETTATVTF